MPSRKKTDEMRLASAKELRALIKGLRVTQVFFADATGEAEPERIRRTEVSRAAKHGVPDTVRWARGIARAVGVTVEDAADFLDQVIGAKDLLARREARAASRGVTSALPLPTAAKDALQAYARREGRTARPATYGFLQGFCAEHPTHAEAMALHEWLSLIGHVEFDAANAIVVRETTGTQDVSPKIGTAHIRARRAPKVE